MQNMLRVCAALITLSASAFAQDADRARLEKEFAELLTGSRLVGSFTLDGAEDQNLAEDSYTITRVSKVSGDLWKFEASVEYRGTPIPIALNLPVVWAGETPMISVTDMEFPMLGKYSARVLFHGDGYAGLWNGVGYGGAMFGKVVRDDEGDDGEDGDHEDHDHGDDDGDGGPGGSGVVPGEDGGEDEVADGTNWPSFRGYRGRGTSEGYVLPVEWNVETGEGIKWKTEVAGMSHSSPVIWGDKLFVTSAVRVDGEQPLQVGLYGSIQPSKTRSTMSYSNPLRSTNTWR